MEDPKKQNDADAPMRYSSRAVYLLAFLPLMLTGLKAQERVVPLKNWATPLYWQPSQAERKAAAEALSQSPAPQVVFSSNQVSSNALIFVAVTPCRLVDTRGSSGGFHGDSPFAGPSLTTGMTQTFPVQSATEVDTSAPAPCGTIPSIAQAYSFNVTVVPHGGGAVDYISIWPDGGAQPIVSTLNDVQGEVVANAAIVPAGSPSGGVKVYNSGPTTTDVIIDMNGFFAAPTDLYGNTVNGAGALHSDTTGYQNTASGDGALSDNSSGINNTASGYAALYSNTTGGGNTAIGYEALSTNTTGGANIGIGPETGETLDNSSLTSSDNIFLGAYSTASTGTLSNATAIGANAVVAESNAIVLGGITGMHGGTSVSVGIGTTTPAYALHVLDIGSAGGLVGTDGTAIGGFSSIAGDSGVYGYNSSTTSTAGSNGGSFVTYNPAGAGVYAANFGTGGTNYAGYFVGNVSISGTLTKGSGSFKIDHPLDPSNKYLSHSFVESPDMMNVYDGVIVLDAHGSAWVTLPDYFEALNRDFRYQLTALGAPGPKLYVAQEVSGNRFKIAGGKAHGKVSWQVTGIRQDAYANAHRIPNEEIKPPGEQGKYLHPELFGASQAQAIGFGPAPRPAVAGATPAAALSPR